MQHPLVSHFIWEGLQQRAASNVLRHAAVRHDAAPVGRVKRLAKVLTPL